MDGLRFRKTSLQKILEETLARIPQAADVRIVLRILSDRDEAWIDQERIGTVVYDLLKNALEAMDQAGTLTIVLGGDDGEAIISIGDTGRGIPEENIPLLFTPFFTTKPVGEGTGLGLPSAYATVKAHRGDISVVSNANQEKGPTGTTVTIKLPRRQAFQEKEAKIILHEED